MAMDNACDGRIPALNCNFMTPGYADLSVSWGYIGIPCQIKLSDR